MTGERSRGSSSMHDKTSDTGTSDLIETAQPTSPSMAERTEALAAALQKHSKDNDKLGYYDPLLSVVSPPSGHKRMRGGYKIWPENGANPASTLRILSMGNSTSVWPRSNWSELLAEKLEEEGHSLTLFHGAGKGSTSSQEVLRVLRDAPGIDPHLVISLSGITDIGYLLLAMDNPFAHKYTRRVMNFLAETEMVTDVVYGYPNTLSPAQSWCRNQRIARVLADEMGIPLLVFLQPVQGYGAYDMSEEEEAFFQKKASVVLQAINKPYGQCVVEFYEEVRSIISEDPEKYDHIIDFTDVFADCPGAYRDHRHQSPEGVSHLAARMLPIVREQVQKITRQDDACGGAGVPKHKP